MNAVVNFNGINLEVLKFNDTWALSNKQVADGFGVSEEAIRSQKSRGEYRNNVHFYTVANCNGGGDLTFWTKKGVITLGFKLRETPQTIAFRDWASDFIIKSDEIIPNKEQNFSQALNLISSAMQTMLKQNSAILELLKQRSEGEFRLADKPISRVYHRRLSNEEKFIEKVIAALKKEEGIKQGELLARVGTYKNNRSALNWLHSYDGIYWRANLLDAGKYTYSYSLIEE